MNQMGYINSNRHFIHLKQRKGVIWDCMEKPGNGRIGEGQIRHKGLGGDSVSSFLSSDLFYSEMTTCSVLVTPFSSITVAK